MKKKFLATLCVVGAFGVLCTPARAQSEPQHPLQVSLAAQKIEVTNGKETFKDAGRVKPGDVIEYRSVYVNRGKESLKGVSGTLPIPTGTEYIIESANPSNVNANTVTNPAYAPAPLTRTISVNGAARTVRVPASEYKSLRWDLGEIRAGERRAVSLRVRVLSNQFEKATPTKQ